MFCRKCGNNLADDSVFCAKCGTKVDELKQEPQQVVMQEVVPVAPVEMPQPAPQQVVVQEVAPTEIPQPVPQQTTYNQKATNNNEISGEVAVAIKKFNKNKKIFFVLLPITVVLAIVTAIRYISYQLSPVEGFDALVQFTSIRVMFLITLALLYVAELFEKKIEKYAKKMPEAMLIKEKRTLNILRKCKIVIWIVFAIFALFGLANMAIGMSQM